MPDNHIIIKQQDLAAKTHPDHEVFVQLYRQHYDGVFRYCAHRLFDRNAAEDVTSNVFLKVVQNYHRFQGDQTAFRAWLFRIATNTINSHLRALAHEKKLIHTAAQLSADGSSIDVNALSEQAQKIILLKKALLSLKPQYQTIITLRYFEGMKSTEIAGILECHDGTVRSQLARALAQLRKAMANSQKKII